jgi:hypothetical protein
MRQRGLDVRIMIGLGSYPVEVNKKDTLTSKRIVTIYEAAWSNDVHYDFKILRPDSYPL